MFEFILTIAGISITLTLIAMFSKLPVRKQISIKLSTLLTSLFVGIVMFAWWFVTNGATIEQRMISPIILPSPWEVLKAFPVLHTQQGLMLSVIVSFVRVITGFFLAVILAIPLGTYMSSLKPFESFFKPLALIGSYVPIISFIPLTLAWFGSGEMQKIGFLFIASFVVLLPLIIKSINDVSSSFLDVARTKGATEWQLIKNVLIPVAMPNIWDHLRGVYGVGWGWIILAEVINAQNGIGYLMFASERRCQTASIFAIIIVIVIIATISDKIWKTLGNVFFPYRTAA